jgi:hypothetical protein
VSTLPNDPENRAASWEPGRPIPGAREWLNEHWGEYWGEWVAVRDGKLLGHASTLAELEEKVGDIRKIGAHITKMV